MGAGRVLQCVKTENAQRVVDVLGGAWAEAWDPRDLEECGWHLGLEAGQERQLSGGDVFDDLFLDRLADAGDLLQPAFFDQVLDLGRQVVELAHRLTIGADLEEILAADLEQVGDPIEHGRDVRIPHLA